MIRANLNGWTFEQLVALRDTTCGLEHSPAATKVIQAIKSNMGDDYAPTNMIVTQDALNNKFAFTEAHCEIGAFVDELSMLMAALDIKYAVVVNYSGAQQGNSKGAVVVNGYEDARWVYPEEANGTAAIMNTNVQITDALPLLDDIDSHHDERTGELFIQCESGVFCHLHFVGSVWCATMYASAWSYLKGCAMPTSTGRYPDLAQAITDNRAM